MRKILIACVFLTACVPPAQQQIVTAHNQAEAAEQSCDARKQAGQIKSWNGLSACYTNEVMPIYRSVNYPNMDLVELGFAKYVHINEMAAKRKISPAEATMMKKQVKAEINQAFIDRSNAASQAQAQQLQALSQWQQATQPQRTMMNCTTMNSGTMGSINCY
jgi:hypothetical protein